MELLVAMALIVLIMAILSQAFAAGVGTLRQLKALGDMQEQLRAGAAALRSDLAETHFQTREFIFRTLQSGAGDPQEAAALIEDYERICAQTEQLSADLRRVNPPNRVAQRVLRQTLEDLSRLKLSAQLMIELLRVFEDQSAKTPDGRISLGLERAPRPTISHGPTACNSGFPASPSSKFSTEISAIFCRVCSVALPRCGAMITLPSDRSGWSLGNGSGSVTSSAAA